MSRNLRLLVVVIGAGAAARLGLHEWTTTYQIDDHWVTGLVAVLAAISIAEPLVVVTARALRPLGEKELEQLDEVMKTALVRVIDYCSGDYRRMAVNVYLVRRTWRHPFEGEQVRVRRHRLAASPAASSIRWTKGKGLIGQVWEQLQELSVDVRQLYAGLGLQCDRATWDKQPDDVKLGMAYEEYRQVSNYGVIVGAPILKGGKYKGCVSMDSPESYGGRAESNEVANNLMMLARMVAVWT